MGRAGVQAVLLALFWTGALGDQCCWCGKRYFQGTPQLSNESDYTGVKSWEAAVLLDKGFYVKGLDESAFIHVHLVHSITDASIKIQIADESDTSIIPLINPVSTLGDFAIFRVPLAISLHSDTTTTVMWELLQSSTSIKQGSLQVVIAANLEYLKRVQASRIVHRADGQRRWIERFESSSERSDPKLYFAYGWFVSWPLIANNQPNTTHNKFIGNMVHPVSPYEPGGLEAVEQVLNASASVNLQWMYDMRHNTQNITAITEQVTRFREYPGIFSWYIADEPDGAGDTEGFPIGVPPSVVRKAFETIKNLDPFHPVSLVLNCRYSAPLYADAADILMVDPYPVAINNTFCSSMYGCCGCDDCSGSLTDVSERLDSTAASIAHSKPLHFVGQGFGGSEHWSRAPTVDEFRAMTYLSAIHDSSGGASYWLQSDDANPLVDSTQDLFHELTLIAEIAYTHASVWLFPVANFDVVHVGAWCTSNSALVAVVNTAHDILDILSIDSMNLETCSKDAPICPKVTSVVGGGNPKISNNRITDQAGLAAFGTRIYGLDLRCDGAEILQKN
eukprot:c4119_g1_i1.p1 GENE.c4119_g1_i1~~c4119_g1_i1.p1  ORF type:complete len:562 (+),score=131.29 c4119_g1_i1:44-1729(+)